MILKLIKFFTRFIKEQFIYVEYRFLLTERSKKIKSLKNKYKNVENKRCFVIGNGPSLNDVDFSKLKNDVTIAANGFLFKSKDNNFFPNYYLAEDTLVFGNYPDLLDSSFYEDVQKIFPVDFFSKTKTKKNIIYVNFIRSSLKRLFSSSPKFSYHFDKKVYYGNTVGYMMIQFAYYLGFKEIYMIGFDLGYSIPKDAVIKNGKVYFPKGIKDVNHFMNNQSKKRAFVGFLSDVSKMKKSFLKAFLSMQKKDVKLYNSTKGGDLNNIPRKKMEDIIDYDN